MILVTILNIAIFQGLVLGLIIFKSPIFKSHANTYLAYAIFLLSVLLLNLVFEVTNIYEYLPWLLYIDNIGLELLFPVFIFLFIIHQVDHPIKSSKHLRWFYVPFAYTMVLNTFENFETVLNVYSWSFHEPILEFLNFVQVLLTLFFIPGILLYARTFIGFSKNSNEKKWLTHLWLQVFVFFVSFVFVIVFSIIFGIFSDYDVFDPTMKGLAVLSTFLIHWTVYYGIFKYKLAEDKEEIKALIDRQRLMTTDRDSSKNQHIKANDHEKAETLTKENVYFRQLEELFVNEHIYRDSSLDRDKVAEKLGISTGYVSQIINTITGDNFSTYMNKYRVEAVKDIIVNSEFENYSLLAIGLECGFSSKTTFHNAFKKITGMTPNMYRLKYK
ncbi:AraC family transcriptional regulator [Aquimarina sp. D1M17]|uniref:helix-turn-helix domain-containing protein n=1 Tax=Aquimarina acroporae TaxID=2937283 RepID=UPI0020C05A3E|nr:AraC family transcriptional regulator [Aquimarina acroporae]MCK8522965.1 AraC family transcriptional regulator [Aquimarina acroporae]